MEEEKILKVLTDKRDQVSPTHQVTDNSIKHIASEFVQANPNLADDADLNTLLAPQFQKIVDIQQGINSFQAEEARKKAEYDKNNPPAATPPAAKGDNHAAEGVDEKLNATLKPFMDKMESIERRLKEESDAKAKEIKKTEILNIAFPGNDEDSKKAREKMSPLLDTFGINPESDTTKVADALKTAFSAANFRESKADGSVSVKSAKGSPSVPSGNSWGPTIDRRDPNNPNYQKGETKK